MPNYYNNYGNLGGYSGMQNSGFPVNSNVIRPPQPVNYGYPQPQPMGERIYVNGRAGADAYPIPMGVNQIVLWDTESRRFFVKGYDNNGMPRVLEDNDYGAHVEPEAAPQQHIDMSNYATKDDIRTMIIEASKSYKTPDLTGYVTRQDFDRALSSLSVGNGGRIVRADDSNV